MIPREGVECETEGLVSLISLKPGEKGIIEFICGGSRVVQRLMDLGIISGVEVKIEKVAPLGDPIDIQLRAYHLSLRKEEAVCILVEPVE